MIIKEKEFLNFKEVLELLGISRSTLYKLSASGMIPHYKPTGGKLFFKKTEVLDWVKKRVVDNATNNGVSLNLKNETDVK